MLHNLIKTGLSIIILITALIPATAQSSYDGIDTIYGSDPLLFNGRQYFYQIPPGSSGNPFLSGPLFRKGWITIADRQYQHLDLNYDIINQVLLLKYIDPAGYTMVIEVSESWLTTFGIGTSEFELVRQNEKPSIYQVIQSNNVTVRYHWQKELKLENVMNSASYAFSEPRKTSYLVLHGKEYEYKKNRDFVMAFDPAMQPSVSKYLKNNKIKVNRASDPSIQALVNFCNNLIRQ
jgi:hypothetical protein